jgi:predicted metal-dependent HD superfamily phosphohydrolase
VRAEWDIAVAQLGGQITSAGDSLVRRYAEPHRKYHNASHISAVLRDARLLSDVDSPVLVLAICAHDVVYDASPGDDERASAAWARSALSAAGVGDSHIAHVESLVLATITHQSADPLACILLDADLAVLAGGRDEYDSYVRCVRAEYSLYSDDVWRSGRGRVLRSLLERPDLYQTDRGRALWDSQARVNLQRELDSLGL